MIFSIRMLLSVLAIVGWSTRSAAADYDLRFLPFAVDADEPHLAFLVGDITSRAALNMQRLSDAYPEIEALVLESDGGDAHAALTSARIVDEMNWRTIIPMGAGCYSACAFLYFAGSFRYAGGELGVHQTSSERESNFESQLTVADIIEVLSAFDVDQQVYRIMFSTPPEDMYVFSERELISLGLVGERKPSVVGDVAASEMTPSSIPEFRRYYQTDFFGDDLYPEGVKNVTLQQCEQICAKSKRCVAYTFVVDMNWCWPKHNLGVRRPDSRMISGILR